MSLPWQFGAVFGQEKVAEKVLNGASIDDILYNNGKDLFSISDERKNGKVYRYIAESFYNTRFSGKHRKITNKEAYDMFGIEGMEEAIEKTYSMKDMTQLLRDEKINQIIS